MKAFNFIPNLRWADRGAGAFTRDAGLSRFSAQRFTQQRLLPFTKAGDTGFTLNKN